MQSIFMVCLLWELPGQASLEATSPGERATGEMVGQKDATGWLQRLLEPTPTGSWLGDRGIVLRGFTNGNFTAAIGVPTLDGLGAVGGGAHGADEHVVLSRMADRAALVAGLCQRLSSMASRLEPVRVPADR